MKRSAFLKSTVAAAGAAGASRISPSATASAAASTPASHEYIEIRKYTLPSPAKQALLDAYLRDDAIPGLNRLGVSSVGVYYQDKPDPKPLVFVILRHASLEQFAASTQLLSDATVQKAGADYLGVLAADPVYERIESWLTECIGGMPKLAVPPKGQQTYQLRIYESHSEMAGRKKVEMFNTAELALFRRSGMEPVFFGQTIIGPNMPNLTYMLSFKDIAAKEAGWKTFAGSPEWAKLKTTPGFTDKEIVFRITNLMLVPAPYTQI
jgi:hypothetical protein